MPEHTTNYCGTFIEVAEDCPSPAGVIPPQKEPKTIAAIQFELISANPYVYTSDDVIFETYCRRQTETGDKASMRREFFATGRACMRSSPLAKTYGWGIHANDEGKIAVVARGTTEYNRLANDATIIHLKAMRSKRAGA